MVVRPRRSSLEPHALQILLVEDEDSARLAMERTLRILGHRCRSAVDGAEALALYEEHPPDVIITDCVMPRLGGLELCQIVRSRESNRYSYVILMSGVFDKKHFLAGMRAGADDYLGKPVDLEELEARLGSAARVTGLHRRLRVQAALLSRSNRRNFTAARRDSLTHAGNRRGLEEDLRQLQLSRDSSHIIALCDLDDFKKYNDTFGHVEGDRALALVTDALRSAIRRDDGLYRYGGEELLILLPDQTLQDGFAAMDRARSAVEALALPGGRGSVTGRLTVSIGIAERRAGEDLPDELWVTRADGALYKAKALGKNRVEVASR